MLVTQSSAKSQHVKPTPEDLYCPKTLSTNSGRSQHALSRGNSCFTSVDSTALHRNEHNHHMAMPRVKCQEVIASHPLYSKCKRIRSWAASISCCCFGKRDWTGQSPEVPAGFASEPCGTAQHHGRSTSAVCAPLPIAASHLLTPLPEAGWGRQPPSVWPPW